MLEQEAAIPKLFPQSWEYEIVQNRMQKAKTRLHSKAIIIIIIMKTSCHLHDRKILWCHLQWDSVGC